VSFLRTIDGTAWFAQDDLRPFGLFLRMAWRLATRPFACEQKHVRPHRSATGLAIPRLAPVRL
jgi:hypothetical protein